MIGYFILGAALLFAFVLGGHAIANAKPGTLLKILRWTGLIGFAGAALFFALTGRFQIASGLFIASLFFLRNKPFFSSSSPSSGQSSDVNTEWLHATLDHDSGEMDATIKQGEFEGATLSQLSFEDLLKLETVLIKDQQSLAILQAYIDRNFERGSQHSHQEDASESTNTRQNNQMTKAEAYEILELEVGASLNEIRAAHRRLMKKFHPDHQGSAYMAAKLNEARDILTKQ
ncbi:DnaJ domain-containing protein [Sneathiella limimaris]|uniref:DnaJ domain-containing protein n=1 Tax=Sneathiella limimaris TaxID=1964213 RepID=UPI00146CF89D|nr:DnaJ domain-containing protein [Sneathiella limimaris]